MQPTLSSFCRAAAQFNPGLEVLRRDYGETKEGIRCGGGGQRLESCVGIGSYESEARVGWEGFQIEHEALGSETPPKGRNSKQLGVSVVR